MSTNNRASLLAGLRTGGVRSATNPIPHTSAPSVTSFKHTDHPMSAAVNGSFHSIQAQAQAQAQAQVFQMQMMQMEIMRLQVLQQAQQTQQYQLELARQQQNVGRRSSQALEPSTAGPATTSFNRSRPSQAEQLKAQLHLNSVSEDHVPMTAALGGKFGGRLNPHATAFRFGGGSDEGEALKEASGGVTAPANTPMTPSHTTVISGGTPLGLANGTAVPATPQSAMTASKSDTSVNWRKGNNSALNGNRTASVNVRITPPSCERVSPPPTFPQPPAVKNRPQPLRFSVAVSTPLPSVSIDTSEGDATEDMDDSSSSSAKSGSSPTTPRSSSSNGSASGNSPLTPREEASKRLYEGLGIGRPAPQTAQVLTHSFAGVNGNSDGMMIPHTSIGAAFPGRLTSQPMRQPRGPPSGADELGPKNFATRIRRKAIGGLGAMLDARVGRREVEAF